MLLNNLQNEFEVIIQQCSETEASNFFSIISQVLLKSVVIYVKEESIAHILLQLIYFNQQKLTVFEIYWKDIITSMRKKLTRSQVALSYFIKEYTKQHCIDFILLDINSMLSYFLFSSKHYVNILRCPSIACWLNGRF